MTRLLAATWMFAYLAQAQADLCSLSGSVRDSKQAAVAGAQVQLSGGGVPVRAVKTDAKGLFSFSGLSPGGYTVAVTASGFKAYSKTGISLQAGERRVLGPIPMKPAIGPKGDVAVAPSGYQAEQGRNAGAVIALLSPAGAKQFHGSIEWGYRHESYAANDFFNNRNGIAKPRSRGHNGVYTISGPLYFPGGFNRGRTKAFFYFSQSLQRQLASYGSRSVRVPTEMERMGDFSQSFDAAGRLIPIYDPAAGQRPFPNQVIPANRFHSAGQNILRLFPSPNFTDPVMARRYQWNYISSANHSYPKRSNLLRLDLSPRKNIQVNLRVSQTRDEQVSPYGLPVGGAMNFPLTGIVFQQPASGVAIHVIGTLSKKTVNSFIFGVSRDQRRYFPDLPERVSRKATGIDLPQWFPASNPEGLLPNMSFGGVPNYANPSLPNGVPFLSSNRMFSVADNLGLVRGSHSYKLGVYIERSLRDESAPLINRGVFVFDRDRGNPFDANYAYANALLGTYLSYKEPTANPRGQFRFTNVEFYAQDAWRVRSNLMVDYGVRLQHNPPQYDRRNQLAAFVPALYNPAIAPGLLRPALNAVGKRVALDPASGTTYPEELIGMLAPGSGDLAAGMAVGGAGVLPSGLYSLPFFAAGPRFGISWDPLRRGRTVLRAGGGAFFDRVSLSPALNALTNAPLVYTRLVYYGDLDRLAETVARQVIVPAASMTSLLGNNRMPTVYNFSFGIQQQIARGLIIDIFYVGSLSRHLLWQRNINAVPPGANHLDLHPENGDRTTPSRPLPWNFLRPYRGYGDINLIEFASTANYNSLQLGVNRRMARGIQATASYAMGKVLGSAAAEGTAVSPFFSPRTRNYGPLPSDKKHVVSLRYTWSPPKLGKRLRWRLLAMAADGWELAGMGQFATGTPFLPGFGTVDGQDVTGTPSESARVSVGDPLAGPERRFVRGPRGGFGNAGTGILRTNGINNWDVSANRMFRLAKGWLLRFRVETYNTLNHTQFAALSPNTRFDAQGNQLDAMFLQPISARSPRRLQFTIRLAW